MAQNLTPGQAPEFQRLCWILVRSLAAHHKIGLEISSGIALPRISASGPTGEKNHH